MAQLTGTDERLLSVAARDAAVLYSPLGGSFPEGETVRMTSSMPSPFGGGSIQSTMSISTRATEPAGAAMELQVDEEIDRAALAEVTGELLQPMIQAAGRPEAAEEMRKALASMTLRRATTYRVQLSSSWAQHVHWQQTTEVTGRQRVDSLEFKRTR
ncbi:hypothetical protein M8A51_23890 [Schlegelella sp. S2-27]|uniref:Uncharacterized protein n=1 Tax=Caldimonas mangrovi TaxID=2944811 RepID=A0ABT0YV02_9BURK|nr:hypothetical protein [Caldimonas mangrovi]MCM5682584.1 hypothetical protein [Caldimonas mangrovi]